MGFCGRTQRVIVYAGHPLQFHMEPAVAAAAVAAIIIIFLQVLRNGRNGCRVNWRLADWLTVDGSVLSSHYYSASTFSALFLCYFTIMCFFDFISFLLLSGFFFSYFFFTCHKWFIKFYTLVHKGNRLLHFPLTAMRMQLALKISSKDLQRQLSRY